VKIISQKIQNCHETGFPEITSDLEGGGSEWLLVSDEIKVSVSKTVCNVMYFASSRSTLKKLYQGSVQQCHNKYEVTKKQSKIDNLFD
jgi:hypothetical protein